MDSFLPILVQAGVEEAKRALDLFQANALQIHVMPQELVMPEEIVIS